MKKAFSILIIAVLCFSMISLFAKVSTVKADVLPLYILSDGWIMAYAPTYAVAHDKATGQYLDDESNEVFVGQYNSSVSFNIYRGYQIFDTQLLPDTANITGAVLSIYITEDNSDTDFNVTIQNGQPTYPHIPLQTGDYYYDHYSGDGGSRNTTDGLSVGSYWNITFSEDGLDWISLTGYTKLCLRSSNDINEISSTGDEYIVFYSAETGGQQKAKLYITYTVPTTPSEGAYSYTFYGPFDEETGYALDENVTVGVWSSEGLGFETFNLTDGSYIYNVSTLVRFFQFTFEDGSKRQYWVDPSEAGNYTEIYVFWANTTTYAINFLDTTSILDTYPFVTAKRYINGSLYTVEKRKVDIYNTVLLNLINGRTYTLYLGNAETTYVFGELTMTSTTGVQLTLRGVDFPKQTLLTQKYVNCYAYRNGTSIIIYYNDTSEATQSVSISIQYSNFAEAYSNVLYTNSFSLEWTEADEDLGYVVVVTATHETYGTLTYKTILPADTSVSVAPFNLDWLGTWTFSSEYLLPSFIILMVAGCFSALNAEVGAILMCFVAIVLTAMGWIPIPAGFLVTGITLAIIMALVAHKRRGGA